MTTIATQLQSQVGTAGRRSAVIAASSGLVVSLGVTAADAAPVGGDVDDAPKATQPAAPAAPVAAEPEQQQITVAADVETAYVSPVATTLVAPPKPKPVVTRTAERTSRSSQRTAPAAASPAEPAESSQDLSATRANVIAVAARYVGVPYRYGGTSPSGFDCSGYVQYVFDQVGVSLPRTSSAQAAAGVRISASEAQPGDLVYMPGHIGIYAGGNQMYDAPSSGGSVSKREIWSSGFGYYRVLGG